MARRLLLCLACVLLLAAPAAAGDIHRKKREIDEVARRSFQGAQLPDDIETGFTERSNFGPADAATFPSGAINDSSPESGFSAVNRTRNGAPLQGVTGDGRTASSAASSQDAPCARASPAANVPAISAKAVMAAN